MMPFISTITHTTSRPEDVIIEICDLRVIEALRAFGVSPTSMITSRDMDPLFDFGGRIIDYASTGRRTVRAKFMMKDFARLEDTACMIYDCAAQGEMVQGRHLGEAAWALTPQETTALQQLDEDFPMIDLRGKADGLGAIVYASHFDDETRRAVRTLIACGDYGKWQQMMYGSPMIMKYAKKIVWADVGKSE